MPVNEIKYQEKWFWWLLAATSAILLIRLGATPIYILDEAKNAECANEMMQHHNWIVPTFNSELRTDKPPLHYFFMILSYKIWGVNAFAARFFSAITGIGTIWITYFYSKKYFHPFIAFCSVLPLALSTHFLFEFRLSVPDPYLIFFTTLGLFSSFTWLQERKVFQLYLTVFALGMATLAKGPVALGLPGIILLIWIIWQKKWKSFFTWHLAPAFILLLLVVMPWYLSVYYATNGEWVKAFLFEHNIDRFSSPQEGHGGLFILPVLFVLIGLLPFTSFTGEMLRERKKLFSNDLSKFCLLVSLVIIVFFSIASTKLPNYPMIAYAFITILLGNFIAQLLGRSISSKKYPFYILLVFTLLLPVAGYFAIDNEVEALGIRWIALLLLVVPAIFITSLLIKREWNWAEKIKTICLAYFAFNILGLLIVYPTLYNQNPVTKTLKIVQQSHLIIAYKEYNPAYNFNLQNDKIRKYQSIDSLRQELQRHPDAIIISRKEYIDSLQQLPVKIVAEHHDLFELPTTILLKRIN